MSSYDMLITCGYSPAEASKISGQPIPIRHLPPTKPQIAAANEAKYGSDTTMTAEERIMRRLDSSTTHGYKVLRSMRGENGECTTRRGTYRRWKFGKGNIGSRQFERMGFRENVSKGKSK